MAIRAFPTAFLSFFAGELLLPILAALGLALYLLILSPLRPRFQLWGLAGRAALLGLSLVPLAGFIPALVLARNDDHTGLWAAGIASFFSVCVPVLLVLGGEPHYPLPTDADMTLWAKMFVGLLAAVTVLFVVFDILTREKHPEGA